MQITGQYCHDGTLYKYKHPIPVVRFGNQLRVLDTGIVIAVENDIGEWFSSALLSAGIKRRFKVKEKDDD